MSTAYTAMFINGHPDNMVQEFVVDTDEDVAKIDVSQLKPGSRAFVINTSTWYMLNHNWEWNTVDWGGGGGSEYDHVIYNGGEP